MKAKKHRFDDVPKYRTWVKTRDRALEQLHTNAQMRASDVMRDALTAVLQTARAFYGSKANPDVIEHFDHYIKVRFHAAGEQLLAILVRLRKNAYTLAKASESEIIAQLVSTSVNTQVNRAGLDKIHHKPTLAGGAAYHRIKLYLDRLRRKIVNQAQSSALNAKTVDAFLVDVLQSFPKKRRALRPKRILKPQLMEAAGDDEPKFDAAVDIIDQDAWNDMLSDYKDDFVPKYRGPEYEVELGTGDEAETWYAWEYERDLTNEFVASVRDGQIEAANDAGITDFVWIAVVDNVTDACCLWRDGLLISEIEDQLDDHQSEDADCDIDDDGLTPPIHFNCRCTLAPASDTMPEQPDDGTKDFGDWLET